MDLESIECVSSSDGLDEDEIHQHLHNPQHPSHQHHHDFSSSKPRNNVTNTAGIPGPTAIAPATSVHELLECPVCTNSMYPPIHQDFGGLVEPVFESNVDFRDWVVIVRRALLT